MTILHGFTYSGRHANTESSVFPHETVGVSSTPCLGTDITSEDALCLSRDTSHRPSRLNEYLNSPFLHKCLNKEF